MPCRPSIYQAVDSGADYDRIEFVTDVDTDGVSDRVAYEVKDGTLVRTVRSPAEGEWSESYTNEIVHDVSMFRITFLDESRSPVSPDAVLSTQGAAAKWAHVSLAFLDHEREIDAFGGEVEVNGLPTVAAQAF
ncbi:MAG: hypothetical protein ACREQ9_20420 [Candidatus Binatia bacterium]